MVSTSGAWKPAPHIVVTPTTPAPALTESYMQSMSKDSTVWQSQTSTPTSTNQLPADPAGPGGLNLSQYQGYSSESPVWQRMETQPYTSVASVAPADGVKARLVALFHGGSVSKTSAQD